jgi:hypothetical protein
MVDASTLRALAKFPDALEQFYAAVRAANRNWEPASWEGIPSESFSAIGQICHVRDIEIDGYHVRFRRILQEAAPVLDSLDGYQLGVDRDYTHADAAEVLAAFHTGREKTVELLSALSPEQCARTAVFEGYGTVTTRGLAHYLCSHDQQHLAGLQWLLGKMAAT